MASLMKLWPSKCRRASTASEPAKAQTTVDWQRVPMGVLWRRCVLTQSMGYVQRQGQTLLADIDTKLKQSLTYVSLNRYLHSCPFGDFINEREFGIFRHKLKEVRK